MPPSASFCKSWYGPIVSPSAGSAEEPYVPMPGAIKAGGGLSRGLPSASCAASSDSMRRRRASFVPHAVRRKLRARANQPFDEQRERDFPQRQRQTTGFSETLPPVNAISGWPPPEKNLPWPGSLSGDADRLSGLVCQFNAKPTLGVSPVVVGGRSAMPSASAACGIVSPAKYRSLTTAARRGHITSKRVSASSKARRSRASA